MTRKMTRSEKKREIFEKRADETSGENRQHQICLLSLDGLCRFQDKKKKYEPPVPTRVGKRKKKVKGPDAANKLPLGERTFRTKSVSFLEGILVGFCGRGIQRSRQDQLQ